MLTTFMFLIAFAILSVGVVILWSMMASSGEADERAENMYNTIVDEKNRREL